MFTGRHGHCRAVLLRFLQGVSSMDQMTANYYRSILFGDSQNQTPLPPTLVQLHAWAFKRFQMMGAGSIISKQAALCVAMQWLSSTKEGRAFAADNTPIGELFCDPAFALKLQSVEDEITGSLTAQMGIGVDWDAVPSETMVDVSVNQKTFTGKFAGRRGGWIDVLIDGEKKQYRTSQVKLAGA